MGRRHTARPDFSVQRCMMVAVSAMPALAYVMPMSALSARPMLFSRLVGFQRTASYEFSFNSSGMP